MATAPEFNGTLKDIMVHGDYLKEVYGIEDRWSPNDTVFGVDKVYCDSHKRIHSTGWCTVPIHQKLPVDERLPEVYRK